MAKNLLEWAWRLAVLLALGWIGMQLERLHEDIVQPVDDETTVASADNDILDGLEALRDDVDALTRKVDAMLVAMTPR